jgi:Trk K+ transport system NAD-binding subunit
VNIVVDVDEEVVGKADSTVGDAYDTMAVGDDDNKLFSNHNNKMIHRNDRIIIYFYTL